jgi:hypothetical protein
VCVLVMVLLCKNFLLILFLCFKCYREEAKEICCKSCMDCTFWKKALKPKLRDLYILLNICLNISLNIYICVLD